MQPFIQVIDLPDLMQVGPNAGSDPNNNPGNPITPEPGDNEGNDGDGMAKRFNFYGQKDSWE